MSSHTPPPWRTQDGAIRGVERSSIALIVTTNGDTEESAANADFIVRAVNAHDALVEALIEAREYVNEYGCDGADHAALKRIDAALKLAEAKP